MPDNAEWVELQWAFGKERDIWAMHCGGYAQHRYAKEAGENATHKLVDSPSRRLVASMQRQSRVSAARGTWMEQPRLRCQNESARPP